MQYKVEQWFVYGWDDAPWSDNGHIFNNYIDAQQEIDELVDDTRLAAEHGDMEEGYPPGDFRIVAMPEPMDEFTQFERLLLLEIAKIAMVDLNMFDAIADKLDIADKQLIDMRTRLQKILDDQV